MDEGDEGDDFNKIDKNCFIRTQKIEFNKGDPVGENC